MRRIDKTHEFKGSVFVEFADFKDVDAFLKADPKPTWNGSELLIMSKSVLVSSASNYALFHIIFGR